MGTSDDHVCFYLFVLRFENEVLKTVDLFQRRVLKCLDYQVILNLRLQLHVIWSVKSSDITPTVKINKISK